MQGRESKQTAACAKSNPNYNAPVPTPFQHLIYAKTLLESDALPEAIRLIIQRAASSFALGNTAADVQALTGQKRQQTHFYEIPPPKSPRAWETLLNIYPELANPYNLPLEQAAFVSGYLTHLIWDEAWAWDVFCPYYLEATLWPDRRMGSIHHNALRVLLDRKAEKTLHAIPDFISQLKGTIPHNWLPFVPDSALCQWRNWIINQIENPQQVQTADVFAQRMGISVTQLEAVVQTIAIGKDNTNLGNIETALWRFEARATSDSITLLQHYWQLDQEKVDQKIEMRMSQPH